MCLDMIDKGRMSNSDASVMLHTFLDIFFEYIYIYLYLQWETRLTVYSQKPFKRQMHLELQFPNRTCLIEANKVTGYNGGPLFFQRHVMGVIAPNLKNCLSKPFFPMPPTSSNF